MQHLLHMRVVKLVLNRIDVLHRDRAVVYFHVLHFHQFQAELAFEVFDDVLFGLLQLVRPVGASFRLFPVFLIRLLLLDLPLLVQAMKLVMDWSSALQRAIR